MRWLFNNSKCFNSANILALLKLLGIMMFKRFTGAVAAALLFCASSAQAIDYRVDFEVTNFEYFIPGETVEAPFASAVGSAVFSAASLNNEWTALKDFSLVIGDQHYTLADVGYQSFGFGISIGGLLNGTNTMYGGTNDFTLDLFQGVSSLNYATAATNAFWVSSTSTQTFTQLTLAPVPEPEVYAMLLAGLGLLGVAARRRKA